jgi:pimeloyl-ACP methyl ester carboxylesterase
VSTAVEAGHASVNGLEMYYEVHGVQQASPPLLLLHGGLTTIDTSFAKALPFFARTRRVVAVEQQGHGRTADIERPLSFEQAADDTAALLRQLKIETVDVFGFSDGGNVGLGLAIRHPRLARRLVVAGTNANNDGLEAGILEIVKTYAEQDPVATAARMPAALREAYVKVAPRPQDWPTLVSKVMKQGVAFTGWRSEQLKAIGVPVMVAIGDADIIRPEHAVETYRLMPRAQLAVLPGTDHYTLADSDRLLSMIERFLDAPVLK